MKWNGDTGPNRSRISLAVVVVIALAAVAIAVFFVFRPHRLQEKSPLTAVVTAFVQPSTINRGEAAVLRWNSDNIKELYLTSGTDVRKVDLNGETLVSPIESTVFIFSGSDPSGRALRKEIVLSVLQPPLPPKVSLTIKPTIIGKGDSATLKWETTGATVVNISGIGDVSMSGSKTVSPPPGRSTYTVTAAGAGGTVEQNISVVVLQVPIYQGKIVEGYSTMSPWHYDGRLRFVIFQGTDIKIKSPFEGEARAVFTIIERRELAGKSGNFPTVQVKVHDSNGVTLASMSVFGDGVTITVAQGQVVTKGQVIAVTRGNRVNLSFLKLDLVNNERQWTRDQNMFLYYFPTLFDGK
ncbi:MAG: hypothetical protein DDT40_01422 [candidate division WS2 bacterium]|nr:hypothetical protein [Candidatus Psychracetigena formicireducens]